MVSFLRSRLQRVCDFAGRVISQDPVKSHVSQVKIEEEGKCEFIGCEITPITLTRSHGTTLRVGKPVPIACALSYNKRCPGKSAHGVWPVSAREAKCVSLCNYS